MMYVIASSYMNSGLCVGVVTFDACQGRNRRNRRLDLPVLLGGPVADLALHVGQPRSSGLIEVTERTDISCGMAEQTFR